MQLSIVQLNTPIVNAAAIALNVHIFYTKCVLLLLFVNKYLLYCIMYEL